MDDKMNIISSLPLATEEIVGFGAIEILSIPHVSVLQKRFTVIPNIDTEYKQDMARLLSEIFQNYKLNDDGASGLKDISLELLWCTEEAHNQPYKANIKLFIIIRAIDDTVTNAEHRVNSLCLLYTSPSPRD